MLHKIFSCTLLLTILLIAQASAQPNTTTINPSLTIVQPIAITKSTDKDLLFGKFAAYVNATGSIQLSTDGTRSKSGDITLIDIGEPFGAAEFVVTGLAGAAFNLTLPTEEYLVNISNGNGELRVTNFRTDIDGEPTIGQSGTFTFKVGATLTKDDGDERGNYSGTFTLTVNYL